MDRVNHLRGMGAPAAPHPDRQRGAAELALDNLGAYAQRGLRGPAAAQFQAAIIAARNEGASPTPTSDPGIG